MFDEALIVVSSSITIIVIAILTAFTYYKLKLKRLNLIEKGIWKSEYDARQLENMMVGGAILVAIGIAVLVTVFMVADKELLMWILTGSVPLLIGTALIICFLMLRRMTGSGRNRNQ